MAEGAVMKYDLNAIPFQNYLMLKKKQFCRTIENR